MSTRTHRLGAASLRFKLAVLALVIATLPVGVIGWLAIRVNFDTLVTNQRELQIALLEDLARTLDDELGDAEAGLDTIGRVLSDSAIDGDARLALAEATVEARTSLDHAAIYDREGGLIDVIREAGTDTSGLPERLDATLRDAADGQRVVTGPASSDSGAPRVLLVVAIRPEGPGGPVTGYVASRVSLLGVQDRLGLLAAHLGPADDALFVVDQGLQVLVHVDPTRALSSAADEGALAGVDPHSLVPMLARSGEYDDAQGPMVGTLIGLPNRPWAAVAQLPRAVAYAPLERMQTIVWVSVFVAMSLAGLLGVLGASRLTAPLSRLTGFARELAHRRFDQRVVIDRRDELGVLARAMSGAAAELEASEARIARELAIRHDLGRYMPAEIVERVVAREQDMALGGQRREISVMFMDVVAFTPLTERLEPEQVVEILNHLFTISTEIVFRHGGTVDKFIGDSMMALWGAPTALDDHALRAVEAADDILSWLEVANQHFRERYQIAIRLAFGINSGACVVGNIGSDTRMEYTAIGDVVNVAARLEAIARPQQILITRATAEQIGDRFECVDIGVRQLAGRESAIEVLEVRA
ncbi:adenylate/guanylate cyclase domain-containing protein [Nannocystaceae bacterium ST9]